MSEGQHMIFAIGYQQKLYIGYNDGHLHIVAGPFEDRQAAFAGMRKLRQEQPEEYK